MAFAVVTCRCEDHLSPALRSLSHMMLTIPTTAELPALPADLVTAEASQRGGEVGIKIMPSPALTSWIAEVQKVAAAK